MPASLPLDIQNTKADPNSFETATVGQLVMRYPHPRHENQFKSYRGTGTLYAKLTQTVYVVTTAAHTLMFIEDNEGTDKTTKRHPDRVYFFLQRSGR